MLLIKTDQFEHCSQTSFVQVGLMQDPKKAEGLGWGDSVKLVTADVTSNAT